MFALFFPNPGSLILFFSMFVFDFRFDRVDLDFDFGTNVSCFCSEAHHKSSHACTKGGMIRIAPFSHLRQGTASTIESDATKIVIGASSAQKRESPPILEKLAMHTTIVLLH